LKASPEAYACLIPILVAIFYPDESAPRISEKEKILVEWRIINWGAHLKNPEKTEK
jgi:hypothetical protein